MSTALSVIDIKPEGEVVFTEELAIINRIICEYESESERMEAIYAHIWQSVNFPVIDKLMRYNHRPNDRQSSGMPSSINIDWVRDHLRAEYWKRVTDMTNVLLIMPEKRRTEWREQFLYGMGMVEKPGYSPGDPPRYSKEYVGVPEFSRDTVVPTLVGMLNDRHKYLVERVHGIFTRLSPRHKTNKSFGFSEKMIMTNVITDFWQSSVTCSSYMEDTVDDLRILLHMFHSRDCLTHVVRLGNVLSAAFRCEEDYGQWFPIDGGLLNIRYYKNGNVHLQVHPDLAWRLNELLSYALPGAIPSEFRTKPTRPSSTREFSAIERSIPDDVRANLREVKEYKKSGKYSVPGVSCAGKIAEVLGMIGGVQEGHFWLFPYPPLPVIDHIIARGTIPDVVSHQFYPSPENVADFVAQVTEYEPGMTVLEPQAGRADLLVKLELQREDVTLVELNGLMCAVLESKGWPNVQCRDFIEWSAANPEVLFDRIVMNPPFSEGRWKLHLQTAMRHMAVRGRLVAVLPGRPDLASLIDTTCMVGLHGRTFENEFEGTGVTVTVCIFQRYK